MGYSVVPNNPLQGEEILLGSFIEADLNSIADQVILLPSGNKMITSIVFSDCTGTPAISQGGFYSGVAKSGTVYVLASQIFTSLTPAKVFLPVLNNNFIRTNSLILSLTVAEGLALTCNIHIFGKLLD